MGSLLTCVEVRVCVFIHFLVLQNIVGDLGPDSWLNIRPLQGDHCAGGLHCWGQTKPRKGDREVWLFASSIVRAPKEYACLKTKSTGFRLGSNPVSTHQQDSVWTLAIPYISFSLHLLVHKIGIRTATFQDQCGIQ